MPSRSTTSPRRGFIYFPLTEVFYPKWKVIITDSGGTDRYIADFEDGGIAKNYLITARVERPKTERLGNAVVTFANPENTTTNKGVFTDMFSGGEIIRVYADYGTGTTLQFRGKVDNVSQSVTNSNGFTITVDARDYPEMIDQVSTDQAVERTVDVLIWDLITDNGFTDIELAFWDGTSWVGSSFNSTTKVVTWDSAVPTLPTTPITMSWQSRKPWNIITEAAERVSMDCYLDYDEGESKWFLRIFNTGSKQNDAVSITYGGNLISLSNYGVDNNRVYNRISVYGKQESSNIIVLATEEDTTSQANLWRKDKVVSDTSQETDSAARSKAEYELQQGVLEQLNGRATIVGNPNIKPGDQIMVGVPHMGISGYKTVGNVSHTIDGSGFITNVDILSEQEKLARIFKPKVDIEEASQSYVNLNDMKDTYTVFFDESPSLIQTFSNTEEVDGKLVLSSGQTQGSATTHYKSMDYNVTQCELRKYSNFPTDENDTYEVTNDGGVTWESIVIGSGSVHTFSSTGASVGIRITMQRASSTDTSPAYESVCMLMK